MEQGDLFKEAGKERRSKNQQSPLSDRMRPTQLSEVVGQQHLLGEGEVLASAIQSDQLSSVIFWGPPGCGKTTIAKVIAEETQSNFETLSAVMAGVGDLKKVFKKASELFNLHGQRTILFIDEIHRFNKAQQDALLPQVEAGNVILIGATTENPSFAVNAALLSRTSVFELKPLEDVDVESVLQRACADQEKGVGKYSLNFDAKALSFIAQNCQGDARRALDVLEAAVHYVVQKKGTQLDLAVVQKVLTSKTLIHDKSGEGHYNVVSAFIKSMRGSDPDAAIYWMMRMLEAGEDPLFILRRMIIFASEDIGNADSNAIQVAVAADTAFQRLGMPEGIFPLSHCCIYLASAPKSNACYLAFSEAKKDIQKHGTLPVPLKLRNAVTKLMKEWGYGHQYRYPHNEEGFAKGETYLPEKLAGRSYYHPTERGEEKHIKQHLGKLRGGEGR